MTGEVLWSHVYAGHLDDNESVFAIACDAQGNAYVTGRRKNGSQLDDIVVARFAASDGDIDWMENYGGPDYLDDRGWDIVVGPDGHPVITGFFANLDGTANFYTLKVNANTGQEVWSRSIPGAINNPYDKAGWLAVCDDGDIILANRTWTTSTSYDVILFRFDASDGSTVWSSQYDGPSSGSDNAYHMIRDAAGDLLVVGVSNSDYMVLKFDQVDGELIWAGGYDGPPGWYDNAKCVTEGPHGEVIVSGFSDGSGTGWDMATVAFDPNDGSEQWVMRYDTGAGQTDEGAALGVTPGGDLYVAGYGYTEDDGSDMLAVRYRLGTSSAPGGFEGASTVRLSVGPSPYVTGKGTLRFGIGTLASDQMTLSVHGTDGRAYGQAVRPVPAGGELTLTLADLGPDRGRLTPGVYLVRLRGVKEEVSQKVVILQ